ncbi:family 78 glycoside hydrolase catalytic domain [uncultured Arthrobacter sp.]|uniref:family 78 glycoside hydrolase catalytic domain n=1 Tax=uncultured Arthrobacter sp. TaxID=114050 RepID=UPI0028D90C9F|nr:family 78 glycoside hydrolase catalytic domain [uncultured Arthrobacter sp.]
MTTPQPGISVVDFGQNINGWVRLGSLGPGGTHVVLRHGEVLGRAGLVRMENIRAFNFATKMPLAAGQVDEVVSAVGQAMPSSPRHTTHGFRYVQVEGRSGTLAAKDITAVMVHTPMDRIGWFECSDPLLNALHEATLWSLRGNACDVPTDRPQRERSGFTGDWQVFVYTAALMFDVAAFGDKWVEPDSPPNPDPPRDHGILAMAHLFRSASVLTRAAEVLEDAAAAPRYAALAEQVLAAGRTEYLDGNGVLSEESQGHYVHALAFGLVPDELAPQTAARLVELIRATGTGSARFLTTGMLLPALADHGYPHVAYELLVSAAPSWVECWTPAPPPCGSGWME